MYDSGRGKPLSHGPAGRASSPFGGDKTCGGRRRTREELRQRFCQSICRAVVVVGFVLALLLFLGMMGPEEALPGERVAEDVATFYAAQEYDRLMERWGDSGAAQAGAEVKYQEVLSEWNAN